MAESRNHASIAFSTQFTLSEVEIRALDALTGYGDEAFLQVFGEKLGKSYMRDHEAGLRSFFAAVRTQVLPALNDINNVRRDLMDVMEKRAKEWRQANAQ